MNRNWSVDREGSPAVAHGSLPAAGAVVVASIGLGAVRSNPVEAAAYSVSTVDTAGSPGWYASIRLDAVGNPVIAYQAAATRDLRIVHCDDRACAPGGDTITTPDVATKVPATSIRFVIGGAAGSMPAPFTGIIDEPAVYSCALDIEEVDGIFVAGPDGNAL